MLNQTKWLQFQVGPLQNNKKKNSLVSSLVFCLCPEDWLPRSVGFKHWLNVSGTFPLFRRDLIAASLAQEERIYLCNTFGCYSFILLS